jgi:hypothetical protein
MHEANRRTAQLHHPALNIWSVSQMSNFRRSRYVPRSWQKSGLLLPVILTLAGCGASEPGNHQGEATTTTAPISQQIHPDVVSAVVELEADGTYRFEVTISSPYDTPERYADAWRVLSPDGTQLAIRELLHDHADEQPFTRDLSGVEIPDDISVVTIQGRDLVNGWGGDTVEVNLP